MKKSVTSSILILCCFIVVGQNNIFKSQERTRLFDSGWRFKQDSVKEAENPAYDDASWRLLNLPHDWSIEDLPNQIVDSIVGPFSKASISKGATGYTVGGIGWYRNKFTLSNSEQNKNVYINFDGVYMNADVWLNGHHLGNHPYGYSPFNFNLTTYLRPAGQQNVIVVRVRNLGHNSRWYSGSGIYRHVSLTFVNPVHIAPWGILITTPNVSNHSANVDLVATIDNTGKIKNQITLLTELFDSHGRSVGIAQKNAIIGAGGKLEIKQSIEVAHPILWSIERPEIYHALVKIKTGSKFLDLVDMPFGIRSIHFNSQGLTLNGKVIKLRGGCIHHDNGPLGSATLDRAEERKIEILKSNGFNAIRTSHNPPSQQFLDDCDRLGMLVIDEAFDMWNEPKNNDDYHLYFKEWWNKDITSMILRDRNHPSVVLWSIGNEIAERADSLGIATTKMLVDRVHELDSTRPVTEAVCQFWEPANKKYTWEKNTPPIFKLLGVGGYNYQYKDYEKDHLKYPDQIIVGTESFPNEAFENWQKSEKYSYVIGDFVWTAFDYIGEAQIGNAKLVKTNQKQDMASNEVWPWFNAFCGDFDLTGHKKSQSYYRDVVWKRSKIEMMVHRPIPKGMKEVVSAWGWPNEIPSWSWPKSEGDSLQVRVFSLSPIVRLELNGQKIAEQIIPVGSMTAVFKVPYQPGILTARCFDNGKEVSSKSLKTAGSPKRIRLIADRKVIKANLNDLSYITAEVVDENDNIVPYADNINISFHVMGRNGKIVAVANGNPIDMSGFQRVDKKTWGGRCLAILQPSEKAGRMEVIASAKGLINGKIEILIIN